MPCPPGEPGGARTSCLTLLRPSIFFATGTDAGRRAMRRSAHLHSRLRSHRRLGPWHRFGFRLRPTYLFGPPFLHCRPVLPNGRARRCLGHRLRLNPRLGDGGRTPFFTSTSRVATPARHSRRETRTRRNIRSSRRHADLFLSSSSISVNSASTTFSLPDGGAVPDECCDCA